MICKGGTQWFRLSPVDQDDVYGPVMGAGAGRMVRTLDALRGAARRANAGRPTKFYEPSPGCVLAYPEWTVEDNGDPVVVSLVGCILDLAT